MTDNHFTGFSLIELLVSILLFSIVMLGLIEFQTVLTSTIWQAKNRHTAQTMAFEILDRYPDTQIINLPAQWNFKIMTTRYHQCQIVKVIIWIPSTEEISQQRWFCRL